MNEVPLRPHAIALFQGGLYVGTIYEDRNSNSIVCVYIHDWFQYSYYKISVLL